MTVCVFPSPGQTLQVLNTCLLERRGEVGPSSAFTTGSSCTYRKSWDTLTTRATASMLTHPRYDATVLTHWWEISHLLATKLNVSVFFFPLQTWAHFEHMHLPQPRVEGQILTQWICTIFFMFLSHSRFIKHPCFSFLLPTSSLVFYQTTTSYLFCLDCSRTKTNTSWRCSSAGRTA